MNDRSLQLRVGLFVISSGVVAILLMARFGEFRTFWKKTYPIAIHFEEAPGVMVGTPVRKNGITIGYVREVFFDDARGGVTLVVKVEDKYPLRSDSKPRLTRSLLGDSTIEFSHGKSPVELPAGAQLEGEAVGDPTRIIAKLEEKVTLTLDSFEKTSREWQKVGTTVNNLMETQRGNLDHVVEKTAESLHQFTLTMKSANKILGDPQNDLNLRNTLAALPVLVDETQKTIRGVRATVTRLDENLTNLRDATTPLAQRSDAIALKLERSVGHLEVLLSDLSLFSKQLAKRDGSLSLLATDPNLYLNLNESAAQLKLLLKTTEPLLKDARIFTDKIARHPELIGVGGALNGSSGIK